MDEKFTRPKDRNRCRDRCELMSCGYRTAVVSFTCYDSSPRTGASVAGAEQTRPRQTEMNEIEREKEGVYVCKYVLLFSIVNKEWN